MKLLIDLANFSMECPICHAVEIHKDKILIGFVAEIIGFQEEHRKCDGDNIIKEVKPDFNVRL